MRRYLGIPDERTNTGGRRVDVEDADGKRAPLNPRTDLFNHSPNGFEWGYGGSGPAQLALAILADHLASQPAQILAAVTGIGEEWHDGASLADRVAIRLHQAYKLRCIATLRQGEPFELTTNDVSQFIESEILVNLTSPRAGERDES